MRFAGRRACTLPHRPEDALSCAEVREGACSTARVLHRWRSFLSCAIPCFVCALCAGTSCCCASFVSSAEVGVTRVASTRRAVAACGSDPHCALAAPRQRGHGHRNQPCRVADCAAKPWTACRSITTELCTLRLIFLEVCAIWVNSAAFFRNPVSSACRRFVLVCSSTSQTLSSKRTSSILCSRSCQLSSSRHNPTPCHRCCAVARPFARAQAASKHCLA